MALPTVRSAVILVAGAGRRMWPFASVRNKAAMPIANVPNIRRLADSLTAIGIERLVIVTGHESGSVRHALLGSAANITFVIQPSGIGTAGAALLGWQALDDESILVVYGDTVVSEADLSQLRDAISGGAEAATLVDAMPSGEGSLWYSAHVENGILKQVMGHEAGAATRWLGCMVLHRSIIPVLEANPGRLLAVPVGGMPPSEPDLSQSLIDWSGQIAALDAKERVFDLDKPWHALDANMWVAESEASLLTTNIIDPTARIHDGAEIHGFVRLGPGAEIGNRVLIEGNVTIAAGSKVINGAILRGSHVIGTDTLIKDYCVLERRTVVGNHCIVGHGAEMDGVMFDGSYLWHYCEICGLVGASVDIGAATVCGTLRFDDGPAEHKMLGRRERPLVEANSTYFGDYSRTGVNVITNPGAKIGVHTCIGGGIVVTGDVPDRTLRLLKQEVVDREWGPDRYGW